jgi:hypothetical protein
MPHGQAALVGGPVDIRGKELKLGQNPPHFLLEVGKVRIVVVNARVVDPLDNLVLLSDELVQLDIFGFGC